MSVQNSRKMRTKSQAKDEQQSQITIKMDQKQTASQQGANKDKNIEGSSTCERWMGIDTNNDVENPFTPHYIDLEAVENTVVSWQDHFYQKLHGQKEFRNLPVLENKRENQNSFCCFIFLVILSGFIVSVVYFSIALEVQNRFSLPENAAGTFFQGINAEDFTVFLVTIAVSVVVGLAISTFVFFAFQFYETLTVYFLVFSGAATMIGLSIFLMVYTPRSQIVINLPNQREINQYVGSSFTISATEMENAGKSIFALAILYGAALFKLRKYLNNAGKIVNLISFLIKETKTMCSVLGHVSIMVIASFLFMALWVVGFYTCYSSLTFQRKKAQDFLIFSIFWLVSLLFFNFIFYYACVFVNSFLLANLIYGRKLQVCKSYWFLIRYHLGSITFASLTALFVNLLNTIFVVSSLRQSQNKIVAFLGSIVKYGACILTGAMEVYVKMINSNSITGSALTGQSFLDSAKTVGFVCFENYSYFATSEFCSVITRMGIIFSISIIPALGGTIFLFVKTQNIKIIAFGFVIIWLMTSMIGTVVLQMYFDCLNTVMIIYKMNVLTSRKTKRSWSRFLKQHNSKYLRILKNQFGGCKYLEKDAVDKNMKDYIEKFNTKEEAPKVENKAGPKPKAEPKKKKKKTHSHTENTIKNYSPDDNPSVFKQVLSHYCDDGKGDENVFSTDPVIAGRSDYEVDLTLNLVFPKRKAIVHCPQCQIRIIMNIVDDENESDYYEFWPQSVMYQQNRNKMAYKSLQNISQALIGNQKIME